MARGIEGGVIFRDTKDREEFLRRLSENLTSGKANLYAWVLMSNYYSIGIGYVQNQAVEFSQRQPH